MPDDHAALVRAVFERGWNRQDFAFLEERTAPSVTMHYNGRSHTTTAAELPGLVAFWRAAFPDLRFTIRHLIAEGDLVAVSLILRGTHRGVWWGVPPSGAEIEVEETMFFRFEGGLLVEMWELFDERTLRAQIGAGGGG